MGDVQGPTSHSSSRRPRPSVVERWESSVSRWRARSPPPPPRARTLIRRGSTSTVPASTPASAPLESSLASCPDSSTVARNVTVENFSAFDCSICYLPLKSPIFQCTVGHVVCSTCHDKLGQATQCHVCRAPTPGGYLRCHAKEQVVDSIRVLCPHAAHGCAERPVYHDHEAHARTCHCPGEGCGFAGPALTTLLEHFADIHGWPCSSVGSTLGCFDVRLRKGFNVVVTATTEVQYTLVLNVEQAAPVCNAMTAFCIHPSNTGTVRLKLSYYRRCSSYKQDLKVVCTDLSNGMPGPSSCFPFLVPRWSGSAPGGEDDDDIRVTVNYIRGT